MQDKIEQNCRDGYFKKIFAFYKEILVRIGKNGYTEMDSNLE